MMRFSKTPRLAGVTIGAVLLLSACSPIRSLAALSRSTDHFVSFEGDNRIRIEPGAEAFATAVAPYVAQAIRKVEADHYTPFTSEPTIYVCATQASYYRLTGQRAPASVTNRLFLSPQLFQESRPIDRYLTHELSHLHLVQRVGLYDSSRIPAWFKEGLAEVVSGGATGSSVTVTKAYAAINEKRSFVPDEGRNVIVSFLSPRYGGYWHIENRMFYRQSMLFVEFLRECDKDAFQRFLVNVEQGRKFKTVFREAYGCELALLWGKFLERAKTS